jgi:hypothetical protein
MSNSLFLSAVAESLRGNQFFPPDADEQHRIVGEALPHLQPKRRARGVRARPDQVSLDEVVNTRADLTRKFP